MLDLVAGTSVEERALKDYEQGSKLYEDFSKEMEHLCQNGLVDCKLKLIGSDASSDAVVSALTNVFKLVRAGKTRPLPFPI